MPTGVAKNPEERNAKMRATIAARQAAGLRFGRIPLFTMRGKHCAACGKWFRFKAYPDKPLRVVCGSACFRYLGREKRRKIPEDFNLLYDLYWNKNMSTPEIAQHFGGTGHKNVREKMVRLGIPRRKPGHSRVTTCIVDECFDSAYKLIHTNNGSLYGRRCLIHWMAHRKRLASDYWQRIVKWRTREHDFSALIEAAVPKQLPYEVRDEVCQELALELLTGNVKHSDIQIAAKSFIKRFFKEYQNKFGDLSLDAPITEDGFTLGDLLDDQGKIGKAA